MDAQIHAAFTGKLPDGPQRRRSPRRASSVAAVLIPVLPVNAQPASGLDRIPVQVCDWSGDGAGLRVRQPLDVCVSYEIEAVSQQQLLPGTMLRVVASHRDADGWYRIGAVWCEPEAVSLRAAG